MRRLKKFPLLVFVCWITMTILYTCFVPMKLRQELKDLKTKLNEQHANYTNKLKLALKTVEKLKDHVKWNIYGMNRKTPNIELVNSRDIEARDTQIIILVTSHIANKNRRDSIRVNWGDPSKFTKHTRLYNGEATYKVYFMTGYLQNHIGNASLESTIHKDMLIMNRTENYWDLSRKFMLGFLWSLENCQFDYLLKTDDDVFVNIPTLFKLIHKDPFVLKHKDRLYAGHMYEGLGPHRNNFSKWYVSKEEWAPKNYPPFAPGMAVILSRFVIKKMVPYFDWVKPFKLEDVYIGMLVNYANVSGVGIRKPVGVEFYDNLQDRRYCGYSSRVIAFHKILDNYCMTFLTNNSMK
ncbi:beta-1,3-galactosyltransferase 5-like [Clytia hemisphaerica]|uniref:Hexosyltransferase n=1 Tax=Clytia hemisphaerica TaxID=252671 RepID=A0A7M5XHP9_9CNID